ncbi:MAG: metallophosphoesterase, partial [Deltaproteobacteria bacterium]|nr:metallophosphoesterase [Deltaproteobacteria bacterium]
AAAPSASASRPSAGAPLPELPARLPAPERLVAIGDLHGDLAATRRVLRLAGAIDAADRWVGGALVVVQVGDQIDRGDDDRAILELFDRLSDAASAAGGRVVALQGNHEVMNVDGDFRYVTPGAFAAFSPEPATPAVEASLARFPQEARGRAQAFLPGGSAARRLAGRDLVARVGDSAFVHGGLGLDHLRYGLVRMNREVRRWEAGEGPRPEAALSPEGPVWTRRYAEEGREPDCARLGETLAALEVARLVVGHTPQRGGVTSACGGRLQRIDVGMSRSYGGPVQALEIRGAAVTVLREAEAATPG